MNVLRISPCMGCEHRRMGCNCEKYEIFAKLKKLERERKRKEQLGRPYGIKRNIRNGKQQKRNRWKGLKNNDND